MPIFNHIAKNIVLPLSDFLTGNSIYTQLKFLEQSQFWTREQIEFYQNEKLRQIIDHSYRNVPFYTDLFDKLKLKPCDFLSKKDLVKLPILTKEDFRNNKDKWIAKNYKLNKLVYSNSSGSTGEPFSYYTTKWAHSFRLSTAIRAWSWMGYKLGDKYVKTSIQKRASIFKKVQDKLNNSLFVSFIDFESECFTKLNNDIIDYDPSFLRGYPVPLVFLAERIIKDFGTYPGKSLIAINTTGSTLHEKDRKIIEHAFQTSIYDSYSCEGGANFSQCPTHENYHPSAEYAITELLEDDFSASRFDSPKRHITTDLQNYACPFFRYDTQDYVIEGNKSDCSCGRHFINIKKILGRDTDILVTPSGKYILMENILGYFENQMRVIHIQAIQEKIDKIVFNIVVDDLFTRNNLLEIENYWKRFIGGDVSVVVEVVKEIQLTPSGKRRTVIRSADIKLND